MTSDPTIREQSYAYFLQEAPQLLQVLEHELLNLRENWNITKAHTLMRTTHTLKGAAASVGLESIKAVAHSLEDIFKSLCKPDILIDPETEALLFEAYECLRAPLVAEITGTHGNDTEIFDSSAVIFSQLQEKLGCFDSDYIPTSSELGFDVTQSIFEVGVAQRLEEIAKVITTGQPEEVASTILSQAEVFLGLAESLNLPGFGEIATVTLAALARHPDSVIAIAQTALEDFQQGRTSVLAGDRTSGGNPSLVLQQLAKGEAQSAQSAQSAQGDTNSLFDTIWSIADSEDEKSTTTQYKLEIIPAQITQETNSNEHQKQHSTSTSIPDTVRVNIKHLERLNYLIGELLTNQNRQSLEDEKLQGKIQELFTQLQQHQQMLEELQDYFNLEIEPRSHSYLLMHSLLENVLQLQASTNTIDLVAHQSSQLLEKQSRLLTNARNDCLEARMVTLGDVFNRLPRVLQQLATLHNKSVELKLSGTEVLVDKAVAQKLYDPLLHLVRNAFDHGIESIEVRQQQGKSQTGQIEIRAFNQGSNLMIEVQDDGQGLNFEQIRQQAVENNLVSPQQSYHLNEAQLIDLLFEPGFSTATQVSNLSGRGIGLDVVRAQLQALQGSITVHSQTLQGTTFLLQIPFSLTMAKLFLCQAGSMIYALLSDTVEQILMPSSQQLSYWEEGILRWGVGDDEKLVPVRKLEQILNYFSPVTAPPLTHNVENFNPDTPQLGQIMLLRYQDRLLALEVEEILGEQELVIRPIDSIIVPPGYIYGGSIQADGQLALVIDGTVLTKYVFDQSNINPPTKLESSIDISESFVSLISPNSSNYLNPQQSSQPDLGYRNSVAKVLIVDDSLTWRETLALTLQNCGYQVVQVSDGYEAIEQLRSQPDIQLAICDLEMPRMNGFEFLDHRRQDPILSQIPVIILTSSNSEKHHLIASELGANFYINKPYQDAELLAIVTDLTDK